jgi:hypothetical protein
MRFSPRSLLAWFKVVIAGGDPLGRGRLVGMALSDLAEAGPDDGPTDHPAPRRR